MISSVSFGGVLPEMEDAIVTYGNDILRKPTEDITEFDQEVRDLIERMYKLMVDFRGLGVAGPQAGVAKRIFVYDIGEGPHALINPVLHSGSGEEWAIEGCLSIPGLQGEVRRYERVTVSGIDETGQRVKIKAEGLLARVFQHEMDHLDGTLFVDRADPDTLETVPPRVEEEGEEE